MKRPGSALEILAGIALLAGMIGFPICTFYRIPIMHFLARFGILTDMTQKREAYNEWGFQYDLHPELYPTNEYGMNLPWPVVKVADRYFYQIDITGTIAKSPSNHDPGPDPTVTFSMLWNYEQARWALYRALTKACQDGQFVGLEEQFYCVGVAPFRPDGSRTKHVNTPDDAARLQAWCNGPGLHTAGRETVCSSSP